MASRRMVPTRFFKDPDIMSLKSKDTQLILIGLVLLADDEGREFAHAGLLGHEMFYAEEPIEAALAELEANDLLILYQVGKHRYYQLTRWNQWQTLGNKRTPSKHPAPPDTERQEGVPPVPGISRNSPEFSGAFPEFPEFSGESSPQSNLIESNLAGAAGEEKQPGNILPFPARADGGKGQTEETTVHELAQILHLPVTPALARLVTEFEGKPDLSLPGEANAARAWVDNPYSKRQKHTQMTVPFFRRWLLRAQTITAQEATRADPATHPATGTTGRAGPARLPSLMHLDDDRRTGGNRT